MRRSSATLRLNVGENITTVKRHGVDGCKSTTVDESYIEESLSIKAPIAKKAIVVGKAVGPFTC